jgi:hypothetical protein
MADFVSMAGPVHSRAHATAFVAIRFRAGLK